MIHVVCWHEVGQYTPKCIVKIKVFNQVLASVLCDVD
jgi:hypothetical protein